MCDINPKAKVQVLTMDEDALKFQVPFAMAISGPSQVLFMRFISLA